jgi:hypothetical protein
MSKSTAPLPDWEAVLSAAARLQSLLPQAVLVGGTASVIYARHRFSRDADHVHVDLRAHFDEIQAQLESVAERKTARVRRLVLILGRLDGIETGVRQLIRSDPLETKTVSIQDGSITLPIEAEILRIKGALILRRNALRDYLDFVALADHMGEDGVASALTAFDDYYPQDNGQSALQQLLAQLANALPFDLDEIEPDLQDYKNLDPKWHAWANVKAAASRFSAALLDRLPR